MVAIKGDFHFVWSLLHNDEAGTMGDVGLMIVT